MAGISHDGARVLSPPGYRYEDDLSETCISGLDHMAFALAVYPSQATLRCSPRETRFWLVANLYQAGGLHPLGSIEKVSNSESVVYIVFLLHQAYLTHIGWHLS